jgi:hypothetical protein
MDQIPIQNELKHVSKSNILISHINQPNSNIIFSSPSPTQSQVKTLPPIKSTLI